MSERESDATPRTPGHDDVPRRRSRREGGDDGADERTSPQPPGERGGPKGPEPTRFGDWEKNGRCFDF
jgi:hypothetical protein